MEQALANARSELLAADLLAQWTGIGTPASARQKSTPSTSRWSRSGG